MKKNYNVTVKVNYKVFYEDEGWYNDYSYEDITINNIERDEIEEYVNKHKPRPKYMDRDTQYMLTSAEVVEVNEEDEDENVKISADVRDILDEMANDGTV